MNTIQCPHCGLQSQFAPEPQDRQPPSAVEKLIDLIYSITQVSADRIMGGFQTIQQPLHPPYPAIFSPVPPINPNEHSGLDEAISMVCEDQRVQAPDSDALPAMVADGEMMNARMKGETRQPSPGQATASQTMVGGDYNPRLCPQSQALYWYSHPVVDFSILDNLFLTLDDPMVPESAKTALKSTIDQLLTKNNIAAFSPRIGAKYNPIVCRAVSTGYPPEAENRHGDNTVLKVLRRGYRSATTPDLLRAADVVVEKLATADEQKASFEDGFKKNIAQEQNLFSDTDVCLHKPPEAAPQVAPQAAVASVSTPSGS